MRSSLLKKTIIFIVLINSFVFNVFSYDNHPLSITYKEAADLAIAASVDLRFEQKGKQLRNKAWVLGLRNYFPTMRINAQENDRLQIAGSDSFMKNYSINMDQLLWDGGKISMSRKLEKMELNILNSRLDQMADEIVETVLSAYRGILKSRAILDIRNIAINNFYEQIKILEKEIELGLATDLDLAEAELAISDNLIEKLSLEMDIAELEKDFVDLLGLDFLPVLEEKIDIHRKSVLPPVRISTEIAQANNSDLAEARHSIIKRIAEVKYASRNWIPSFRLNLNFGISGQNYPLNKHTWSVGINIDFSNPWLQNTIGFQRGWESSEDLTAILQNSSTMLPDIVSSLGKKQAEILLALEQEKYSFAFIQIGKIIERTIEKCLLAEKKLNLSLDAIETAARRCNLEEIRLNLGEITRVDLIEAQLICIEKEIAAVEAAINLLSVERELERLMNLKPGELENFVNSTELKTRGVF